MRIATVQFAPLLGNGHATIERLARLLPQAAGAHLVVLPELCNSGYNFESAEQAWATSETVDGAFVHFLTSACRTHGFHVVSGLNERDGSRLYKRGPTPNKWFRPRLTWTSPATKTSRPATTSLPTGVQMLTMYREPQPAACVSVPLCGIV